MGSNMIHEADIDERIEKCERILRENPHSQVFAALAESLRKRGELDAAFRVCMRGIRLHPDYGAGRLVMARISYDRKMYDWAERELSDAIKLDGRTRSTDLLEVEILIKRGFFSKAKVILDRLRTADPDNDYYRTLLKDIDEGKAAKKAKLAETEEFYRLSAKEDRASEAQQIADQGELDHEVTFDSTLEILSKFPKVEAVFYASLAGLVDKSVAPESIDLDAHAASLGEICRFVSSSMDSVNFEQWQEILVEAPSRKYLLCSLHERILIVLCREDVNLGSLKLRIAKIGESLRKG
jgi:predicted regulator of Ras-like GTPase activity (Roadblock/LC7/MglB family)